MSGYGDNQRSTSSDETVVRPVTPVSTGRRIRRRSYSVPDEAAPAGVRDQNPYASQPAGRSRRDHSARPASRRSLRFWRWFRALPILAMLVLALVSIGLELAPSQLLRSVLYPVRHADLITASAERHGLDPALVCAVIKTESNWDDDASSSAGAQGLMQLMPSTAREVARLGLVNSSAYDPDDLTDPATNIEYGCAYLEYLQDNVSTLDEQVAAYNAGLSKVEEWKAYSTSDLADAISYPETKIYLERVKRAYSEYQTLYPEGIAS
jgi:soluble lytic murein transglycosylase